MKGRHQTPLAHDVPRKSKQIYTMQVLQIKENGIWCERVYFSLYELPSNGRGGCMSEMPSVICKPNFTECAYMSWRTRVKM